MKPRVLPRVLSAVFAAALCLCLAPGVGAESRRPAKPSESPTVESQDDESAPRRTHRSHIRLGEGSRMVTISDTAFVPKGEVHHDDIVCILGKVRVEGEVTG